MHSSPTNKLLISVVRRGRGDRVVSLAKQAGARGSTVLMGRGTANSGILRFFCLADTEKDIIFTIAANNELPQIIENLRMAPDLCKRMPGIGFVVNVGVFLHLGTPAADLTGKLSSHKTYINQDKNNLMNNQTDHSLICVIANTGFADDIMQAARDAGATGGTIIKARGTAVEKDSSFFGITIVPEKEMVMILVKSTICEKILDAIKNCRFLIEPGVGIAFSLPVESFFPLGKKNNPNIE